MMQAKFFAWLRSCLALWLESGALAAPARASTRHHPQRVLVVRFAHAYEGRGLDPADLIAEGNLGLFSAAEAFDPSVGTRFSTYAFYWVKQAMRSALVNTARTIRLPAYVAQLLV